MVSIASFLPAWKNLLPSLEAVKEEEKGEEKVCCVSELNILCLTQGEKNQHTMLTSSTGESSHWGNYCEAEEMTKKITRSWGKKMQLSASRGSDYIDRTVV